MVHEKFTGKEVEDIKKENPGNKSYCTSRMSAGCYKCIRFCWIYFSMVKYVKENQPKESFISNRMYNE